MPRADREIFNRHVGEDDQEITHIAVVQAYGVTDSNGEPTISEGFASEFEALESVKEFVATAHDGRLVVDTRRIVLDPKSPDHEATSLVVHIVRTPEGPCWGMVIEVA